MSNRSEYKTRAQTLIYDCITENRDRHLTADDITCLLSERGEKIGKTTVYRNLEKLYAKRLIDRCFCGTSACYCASHDHNSIHIICSNCGATEHLECSHIHALTRHIESDHGFSLDNRRSVLYGLCKECSK